jgi:hypothetical protein
LYFVFFIVIFFDFCLKRKNRKKSIFTVVIMGDLEFSSDGSATTHILGLESLEVRGFVFGLFLSGFAKIFLSIIV